MKLNRNIITLALVLVLGLSLLTAATVAAGSTTKDYETFKEVMQEVQHDEAGTGTVHVTVKDNGEEIFTMTAEGTGDKASENFSGKVAVSDGSTAKEFEVYGLDQTMYLIDLTDDAYYKVEHNEEDMEAHWDKHEDKDHKMTDIEEQLFDHFVGDLKENFVVEDLRDGGQSVSFSMEGSEVPTGLNLLIQAAAAADHRSEDYRDDAFEDLPFMDDLDFDGKPVLTEDVQLDAFKVNFLLDAEGRTTSFTLSITISGLDADGEAHVVTVNVNAQMDSSETTPEMIDVDAYDWELIEVEEKEYERSSHRR